MRFLDPHWNECTQRGGAQRDEKREVLVPVSTSRFKITQKVAKSLPQMQECLHTWLQFKRYPEQKER